MVFSELLVRSLCI